VTAWIVIRTHEQTLRDERIGMSLYAIWAVAGSFVLLWLLGVTGVVALGPWAHVLVILAMVLLALTIFTRPRPV